VRALLRKPFVAAHLLNLAAALIGATFNPWMVFYQQAAVSASKTHHT
jgi:Mn2+/Fe2+ NRAMP family transporter